MPRTLYVIPANADPADHAAAALAAGASEIVTGIPAVLADMLDGSDLPTFLEVPDPDDPDAPTPEQLAEADAAEADAAEADAELVDMLGKLAAGNLSSADRAKIPDLAVRTLGGRAKAEQLRGRRD